MPVDPEPVSSWGAYFAALFGAGGGGTALVKQIRAQAKIETRVAALEEVSKVQAAKIDRIDARTERLDERSERAETDRQEMLTILRERR